MTMNTDMPSDWHIQEAIRRTPSATKTVEAIKENPHYFSLVIAHARTLAEFISEPVVHPDEAAAARIVWAGNGDWDNMSDLERAAAAAQFKAEIAARMEGMQPKIGRVSRETLDDFSMVASQRAAMQWILTHLGIEHD